MKTLGLARAGKRGFTLVELLVVIAVIAVLSGLLLPALGKSKSQAQASQCLNNQRQINLALQMFADDHQGYLPGADNTGGNGVGQIISFSDGPETQPPSTLVRLRYLPNERSFACPQVLSSRSIRDAMASFYGWRMAFHYKFNVDFVGSKLSTADMTLPAFRNRQDAQSDDPQWSARKLSDAGVSASGTILAGDCVGTTDVASMVSSAAAGSQAMIFLSALHNQNQRAVVSFADGHLEKTKVESPRPDFFHIGFVPTF